MTTPTADTPTPRTDFQVHSLVESGYPEPYLTDFARTLERELFASLADNARLRDCNQKYARAIHWLEGWFTANVDGGGRHACPWCYGSSDPDGNPRPWGDVKHSDECLIGLALNPPT